jgi:hypothetical protein
MDTCLNTGLSSYYKERFGSQSPEEYQNLRLSHFSKSLASDEIRDVLIHEFERFGSLEASGMTDYSPMYGIGYR